MKEKNFHVLLKTYTCNNIQGGSIAANGFVFLICFQIFGLLISYIAEDNMCRPDRTYFANYAFFYFHLFGGLPGALFSIALQNAFYSRDCSNISFLSKSISWDQRSILRIFRLQAFNLYIIKYLVTISYYKFGTKLLENWSTKYVDFGE